MIGEKKMTPNTVFYDKEKMPVCVSWLPEGYIPYVAEVEADHQNKDMPLIIWLTSADNQGRRMFSRVFRKYKFDKSKITANERFVEYDEYLDTNAASILKTTDIRLVRRFWLNDHELDEMRNRLIIIRDFYNKISTNDIEYIIQGLYGASGAKLYEAEINGEKRYLLLTVRMFASEYGIVNKLLQNTQKSYQDMLNSMNGFNRNSGGYFGGVQPYQQPVQQPASFDTNPDTPFGQHRTDGFTSSYIIWDIHNFSGMESPVEPNEDEARDFLSFVKSTDYHPKLVQAIEQTQQMMIMNQMQSNQMIMNGFQQQLRTQQQCFDRSFNAMKSVSDMNFDMTQHRVAADNAAFDRQARRNHESVMGVNTYQRTDGTNVEISVGADRVFQSSNDPSTVIGISGAGPDTVPFGWTELEKLK